MPNAPQWLADGARHVWRPYTQMKTAPPPAPVVRTEGTRLHLADGRTLLDGIGAWWTSCHGYNHPHILAAMHKQLDVLPHVMFGGLAHEPAYTLAKRLADLLPGDLDHAFFAESGSVSVEIAMKMSLQYWINRGVKGRTKFVSFLGGYHGDTLATMMICDPEEGMHSHFAGVLPPQHVVPLPTDEASMAALREFLAKHRHEIAGIITEPLVQGAGGMLFHDVETLQRTRALADEFDLLLIFDEIFTGFGRTGAFFAMEAANVLPDIVTLSKALTGGVAPLSAAIARAHVFDSFWSDDPAHALMHGPTYMGHALGCAAANASLDLFADGAWRGNVERLSKSLVKGLEPCRALKGVKDVRVKGAIGVVELETAPNHGALSQAFMAKGVWIRPFNRIVYLTPAFITTDDEIATLTQAIFEVLSA